MQRRAVAVYAALFLLIGAASYGLAATAEEPTITLEDPDYELSAGDSFTVDDRTYTVTSIEEMEDEDSGETTFEGTVEWVVSDVEMTESWAHEDTIEYDGDQWEVQIDEDAADPTNFTLVAVLDREGILEDDPDAANETVESDGEEYVNVNGELVPVAEYFPEPATQSVGEGETLTYDNRTVSVDSVTNSSVTVAWTADETRTASLTHGETAELAGENTLLSFFPGGDTVQLTQDTSSYDRQVAAQQQFADRSAGLQYAAVVSLLIVFSLIAFAFLPSRY